MSLFKKKFMKVPHLSIFSAFREIGRNAYVDWICILIISIFSSVILIMGGVYLYWQISTGNYSFDGKTDSIQKKIFDIDKLNSVIERFNSRDEMYLQAKKGYNGPADPSK